MSIPELHYQGFKNFLQGVSKKQISKLLNDFVDKNFESFLYLPAVNRLRDAQRNGHFTAIFSSSPDFIVNEFAKRFNVDECVATKYPVDESGDFCVTSNPITGEEKAKLLSSLVERLGVPLENVTAYSDSFHDLALLKLSGVAVGVNPDSILREYCKNKSLEMI